MSLKHETSVKPDPQLIEIIIKYLSYYHPIPEILKAGLVEKLFDLQVKKGKYLLEQGEKSEFFYFIIKGVIIGYTTRENKKLTTYICTDGDLVSSISGMYGESPSEESIYVVEDSHLIG